MERLNQEAHFAIQAGKELNAIIEHVKEIAQEMVIAIMEHANATLVSQEKNAKQENVSTIAMVMEFVTEEDADAIVGGVE